MIHAPGKGERGGGGAGMELAKEHTLTYLLGVFVLGPANAHAQAAGDWGLQPLPKTNP